MNTTVLSFQNRGIQVCQLHSTHCHILPLIITALLLAIPVGSQSCAMNTLVDCNVTNLQSDYYMRQARSYQREAEYYTRQAQSYDREVDYYNRQAQNYLREAEYYSKLLLSAKS